LCEAAIGLSASVALWAPPSTCSNQAETVPPAGIVMTVFESGETKPVLQAIEEPVTLKTGC
jgi:hypothetical protein